VRLQDSVPADSGGAKFTYVAPCLPAGHGREALRSGLELQIAAADLDHTHAEDHHKAQQVERLRHIAWWLVLLAAMLVTMVAAPLADLWQAINDAAAGGGAAGH
jgi:hypothetical protein